MALFARLLATTLVVLGFAGCVSSDGEADGAHLIAHITAPVEFDHLIVTMDSFEPLDVFPSEPATSYDFDHWEVFSPIQDLKVTVTSDGNAIASGEASKITYAPQDDGTLFARILLPLGP